MTKKKSEPLKGVDLSAAAKAMAEKRKEEEIARNKEEIEHRLRRVYARRDLVRRDVERRKQNLQKAEDRLAKEDKIVAKAEAGDWSFDEELMDPVNLEERDGTVARLHPMHPFVRFR